MVHLKTKKKKNPTRHKAKKVRDLSLLRTPATSRCLPPSGPTSTNRMFPKHFESKPGSRNSRIED